MPLVGAKPLIFWRGWDDNLYYCQGEAENDTKTGIYKLNADGTSTAYGTTPATLTTSPFTKK